MTKYISIALVAVAVTLTACNNTGKQLDGQTPVQQEETMQPVDEIISDSVTNESGQKLNMLFNNSKGTAILTFEGENIELKQDTMASGIKYSNNDYEFTEWHGEIVLKKSGNIVFNYNKK